MALPIWTLSAMKCGNWQDAECSRILGQQQPPIFVTEVTDVSDKKLVVPKPLRNLVLRTRASGADESEDEVRQRVQTALAKAGADCRELRVI
jgi:hypothetical protein